MAERTCAVCGKVLDASEIRLNERQMRSRSRISRYLCRNCRQKEYNNYTQSIMKLIDKREL